MAEILWPWGAAATASLTATGTQAITIGDNLTIIDGVTTQATGNRTINLTIGSVVASGALLFVKSKTNGTETTVFGTGFTAATITGEAGKTYTQGLVYEKTPKQLFNERLKANFYKNNKDAYRADFKAAFGYEPKPIN